MPAASPSIAATTHTTTAPAAYAQPQPHSRATPTSPGVASSGGNGHAIRPPLMKRQSSQSSHSSSRPGLASPAASEQHLQHHAAARVKPRNHHGAKVVLPRNHSSARNLAKMNKQAQGHVAFDDGRRHARQRSHEGDTEIRLPGSLDESVQSRPAMKRNLTAYQLPRTQSQSQVKLKKNLSHGQLSRLGVGGSSRNLAGMGTRAPASPGLKGKSKRPKSAEITPAEYRALQERKGSGQRAKPPARKVGFAVGSSDESGGYDDDDDEVGMKQLDMEGSGLQEDEWTEESASASPYSTRQNTANNSRRTSMNTGAKERSISAATPSDLLAAKVSEGVQRRKSEMEQVEQRAHEDDQSSDVEPASPRTTTRTRGPPASPPVVKQQPQASQDLPQTSHQPPVTSAPVQDNIQQAPRTSIHDYASKDSKEATPPTQILPPAPQQQQPLPKEAPQLSFAPPIYQQDTARGTTQLETHATAPPPRSPLHQGVQQPKKEYANPAAKRVTSQIHLPSPAAVTNVSTLDSFHNKENLHSNASSQTPSLRSSTSNLRASDSTADAEREDDELVSRFVPSTSHPSLGSGANTALNTPKQGSGFHTPEEHQHGMPRDSRTGVNFQLGPTSPGSTISNSSGHTTPAMGRSRTELRLLQEKALADMENRAESAAKPVLPGHVYDRRNESLKSFMSNTEQASGLSMGPQIFQGRFRAVNTELRVVQKFRDPIGEAITRLRGCKGSKLNRPSSSASVTGPGLTRASTGLNMSKSAVNLPSQRTSGALSKSASPPKISGELALKRAGQQTQIGLGGPTAGGSERQQSRRGVSFAGGPPKSREIPGREVAMPPTTTVNGLSSADIARIARELWDDL